MSTSTKPRTLAELVKQRRRLGLPVHRDLARAAASELGGLRLRPGCSLRFVDGQAVSVRTAGGEPVAARRTDLPLDVQYLNLKAALITERFEAELARRERPAQGEASMTVTGDVALPAQAMTDRERAEAYVAGLRRERSGVEGRITRVDVDLSRLGKTKQDEAQAQMLTRQRVQHERQLVAIDAELERMAREMAPA